MVSIMMMSSRLSIIKKQLHVTVFRLIKVKRRHVMPWCLCECYWLSSKLTQQVMLLEGCALVMLPLENFGHCRCRLPLVFSCHCITIIFCFKKATSVSITVQVKTNITGCHDLLWQVVTFRIPPRWKRFFVSFCMVWKQLRSWMWQFF